MQKLLQNLKPSEIDGGESRNSDDEEDDDEDVRKIVERKVSMNEQNVIGMNFEKYNNNKPSTEIRRKIMNYLQEYREGLLSSKETDQNSMETSTAVITKSKSLAHEHFVEICKETGIQKFVFVGYIINNAYSFDQKGWQDMFELVFDELYSQLKLLQLDELLEG